jgi:hypothetical protein
MKTFLQDLFYGVILVVIMLAVAIGIIEDMADL